MLQIISMLEKLFVIKVMVFIILTVFMFFFQSELPPLTRYSVLIEIKACSLSEVDVKVEFIIISSY